MAKTGKKIRVLLADDHAVLRAGLRVLLNAQPDMEVIAEAASAREAWALAAQWKPDVLLLDLSMPGDGAIKLIERLHQECPRTRVIVLTMHDEPTYVPAVLAAGAAGYVVKTAADTEVFAAIRAALQGRLFVTGIHHGKRAAHPRKAGAATLSRRERQVLSLLAQGHTHREMAERLCLSVKTIETYRARIADKLHLETRAELFRYAQGAGLLGRTPALADDLRSNGASRRS